MSASSATTPPEPDRDGPLRRRTVATSHPAGTASVSGSSAPAPSEPTTPAYEPSTPPFPPTFSRRSTGSGESTSSSGTGSPRFEIHDDDPLFSGLSLLDFLNVLDAHLEVWTRPLRRKSVTWREKADRLLDEAKQKGRDTFKVPPLPTVPAFDLGEGLSFRGEREFREGAERKVLSAKDRERLERKYREVRARMRDSVSKVIVKWEEEKTVRLRDKISFLAGVMNVLGTALLLGFHPTWIPDWYSLQMLFYTPYRLYTYKRKMYHYFLFDLCYFVNLLAILYLWVFPGSAFLFEACYGLTLGSLGTAIATWRNSLVFHSLDKVISLAIHIFPPLVFTVIRHFYPEDLAFERYPALKELPHLSPWRSMAICMTTYMIWQLLYFHFVIQLRADKIREGRATSFTFLMNDKKRLIGRIAGKVPPAWRESAFMAGQAVYTFVTLIPPLFWLYDSKAWSSVYLVILFAVSAWNGASFYLEVFARKFEKELLALRKEFDAQQALLARYTANPGMQTPAAGPVREDPLDEAGAELGAEGASGSATPQVVEEEEREEGGGGADGSAAMRKELGTVETPV
ncbi:hypothetical protein JCM10450v2_004096 [Rhodotorula kratochvilovae]